MVHTLPDITNKGCRNLYIKLLHCCSGNVCQIPALGLNDAIRQKCDIVAQGCMRVQVVCTSNIEAADTGCLTNGSLPQLCLTKDQYPEHQPAPALAYSQGRSPLSVQAPFAARYVVAYTELPQAVSLFQPAANCRYIEQAM